MTSDSSLWDFSLRVYQHRGVSEGLLQLQDEHGLDVNIVLFCCWAAVRGRFDREVFETAIAHTADWQANVVGPLRATRSWMKHAVTSSEPETHEALRADIKTQELAAEQIEQRMLDELLQGLVGEPAPNRKAALVHLGHYWSLVTDGSTPLPDAQVTAVLVGCDPEWP